MATCGPDDTRDAMKLCLVDEECAATMTETMEVSSESDIDNWIFVHAVFDGPPSWYDEYVGESCDCDVWPWFGGFA